MEAQGNLKKMTVELKSQVHYRLNLGETEISMNDLIGNSIQFRFDGKINCMSCGNTTPKSFANGFCYKCMISSPMNSECIIRPELCLAHEGKGRDVEWEQKNHLQKHIVYLAAASGLKVGVTRENQIPTRWIDQGAWKAIKLSETPNRHLAGKIEVALKSYISDKTNWQKMLRNVKAAAIDLIEQKKLLNEKLPLELQEYFSSDDAILEIEYPVTAYPLKVKSVGLDKFPIIEGKLKGIRGQYLIFDDDRVMNIRKHNGYYINFNY